MAKKRVKRNVRKSGKDASNSRSLSKNVYNSAPRKFDAMRLLFRNFILFLCIMVISIILGFIFTDTIVDNLFWMLTMLCAFVCLALVLGMLILLFMRALKK